MELWLIFLLAFIPVVESSSLIIVRPFFAGDIEAMTKSFWEFDNAVPCNLQTTTTPVRNLGVPPRARRVGCTMAPKPSTDVPTA